MAVAQPASTAVSATPTTPPRAPILRLPLTEPMTIDPGLAEDSNSVEIVSQLFEGLVSFDQNGNAIGLGAEQWSTSGDGLTYTFTLRKGPSWSDGRPVTAQDYAWAWKRNVSPRTASPVANFLFPIKNAQAINEARLEPEQLGVQARDDRTLVVTLEAPAAYFLRLVSTGALAPLRRDVVENAVDRWTEPQNIVTNGPFRLLQWQHDGQIVLDRNVDYWGQKAALQGVIFRVFPEGAGDQVLEAYQAGELDSSGTDSALELAAEQADRVLNDPGLRNELNVFDQSATLFIVVNARRANLKDPRVRIALGQAVERQKLPDDVLHAVGKPAYTLQPDGIPGRKPAAWPRDDVASARRLLAEAGFPDGKGFPEIAFTFNGSAQWRRLGEYLQRRWRETLGINLRLEPMEWTGFEKWRRGEDWAQRGDLLPGGWFSDYEDPFDWYNVLWDSRSDRLAFNSGWKSDLFDALVRQAASEQDRARRDALYSQAEDILAREYPQVPLFHYGLRSLVRPYVQGFQPERVLGVTRLQKVSFADAR